MSFCHLTTAINVYSCLNPDVLDLVLLVHDTIQSQVIEIVNTAVNDWYDAENFPEADGQCIGEFIEGRLQDNDIDYEIYYKLDNEEDYI